jgi:hypothetical protein
MFVNYFNRKGVYVLLLFQTIKVFKLLLYTFPKETIMAQQQDYAVLLDEIVKIPSEQVGGLTIPVAVMAQEAVNLAAWALHDIDKLEGAGLDWFLVENLPTRAGALRQAESLWIIAQNQRQIAKGLWREQFPIAFNKRQSLLHAFFYAYQKDPFILQCVRSIPKGSSPTQVIQSLRDLALLGSKFPKPLEAIKFEFSLLFQAEELSEYMSKLLSESRASISYKKVKNIRDRAYTYVKDSVSIIRECGCYVFWHNKERYKGYVCLYNKNNRCKHASVS